MTKRMFLALDISAAEKDQIAQWRNLHLLLPFKAIDPKNYHITLAFLGLIDSDQQKRLAQLISQQHSVIKQQLESYKQPEQVLALAISSVGYFKKPQVLHLTPNTCPDWLIYLHKTIIELCQKCGIAQHSSNYQPHVSLYRKAKAPIVAAHDEMLKTVFEHPLSFTSFSLYHSYSALSGVQYQVVNTWELINLQTN